MAISIKYDLCTKVTRGDKERWQKLGVVFENDKGMFAVIDAIPVGFSGMVSFFEPKEREDHTKKAKPTATFDDDAPW